VGRNLRWLTVALSVFIVIHGIYHILGQLQYSFLSESVFEPLSIIALIVFGLMYLTTRKKLRSAIKQDG
jgi:hypothetical protein